MKPDEDVNTTIRTLPINKLSFCLMKPLGDETLSTEILKDGTSLLMMEVSELEKLFKFAGGRVAKHISPTAGENTISMTAWNRQAILESECS